MVVQKQNKVNVKSSKKNRCLNLSGDSVVNTSVTSTASTICKTTDNDIYGLQGKYLLYVSLTKRGFGCGVLTRYPGNFLIMN